MEKPIMKTTSIAELLATQTRLLAIIAKQVIKEPDPELNDIIDAQLEIASRPVKQ